MAELKIGDIVYYNHQLDVSSVGENRPCMIVPAMVTTIHTADLVNLQAFGAGGNQLFSSIARHDGNGGMKPNTWAHR